MATTTSHRPAPRAARLVTPETLSDLLADRTAVLVTDGDGWFEVLTGELAVELAGPDADDPHVIPLVRYVDADRALTAARCSRPATSRVALTTLHREAAAAVDAIAAAHVASFDGAVAR